MTRAAARRAAAALGWPAALALATAAMLAARDRLDKAHVALVYLLVVLGASASGGRARGFGVAAAAFLLFDVLFLPPYGTLVVADPLDYLVLVAFLAASGTATHLLDRARREAQDARARAADVDRLAALGARALVAGRAEGALAGVREAARAALDLDACDAWPAAALAAPAAPASVVLAADAGRVVAERRDGTVRVCGAVGGAVDAGPLGTGASGGVRAALGGLAPAELAALVVPLAVRESAGDARLVGALRLARAAGLPAGDAEWRALDALVYYAALAADRVRLAGEAERAAVLAEAGRAKDALLAAVSHDLRTPLTTIKATAQQLAAAAPDADAAERAQVIEQEADRLARLVADLLDYSRLGAGARPVAAEVNAADDLLDVVQQRALGALADPAAGGRALDVALPPGAPLLLGRFDVGASARVLVNLVENAHKYAPPGAPVELRVRSVADGRDGPPRLAFDVCDRGPGVPPDERDRVFEPFYRGQAAARAGGPADVGGVGLGLAIARQLAEAQGGSLTYAPRPGGGSVFTLELPGAALPDAEPE